MPKKHEPLLLLDNSSLGVIDAGEYKCTAMTFDEARAIIEMYDEQDVVRCFTDSAIERVIHDYLGIERRDYVYKNVRSMRVGQDAIAFKLYVTPSETQPVIQTDIGSEAKKIQNIYVHCLCISRNA